MPTIVELQKKAADLLDESEALVGDETAFNAKLAEADGVGNQIKNMIELERRKAAASAPFKGSTGGTAPAQTKAVKEKGADLSRCIISLAKAKGIGRFAAEFAVEEWGEEGQEIAKALAASSGPNGGFLVPQDMRNELIELLRPASVIMSFNPRRIDMPHGNMTLPGVATGANAAYVGENRNILKTEQTFRAIQLNAKKLAALVPVSNDMLRYPSISADAFVREDLVQALAQKADAVMLRGEGTVWEPKGLRQYAIDAGSVYYFNGNATVNLANVTTDLSMMELALMNANIPMRNMGWIMSPRSAVYLQNMRDGNGNFTFPEMANGKLRGKPFKITTQVPDNIGGSSNGSEVYLVDFSEFIVGESIGLEIVVADGAAYWDNNELVSGFSRDQTVIRAITAHDTALRHPQAVAVMTDVRWGNGA